MAFPGWRVVSSKLRERAVAIIAWLEDNRPRPGSIGQSHAKPPRVAKALAVRLRIGGGRQ